MESTSANKVEYVTASASDADHATKASSRLSIQGESVSMKRTEIEECSSSGISVEQQIEQSKVHWSLLTEFGGEKAEDGIPPPRKWQRLSLCCFNPEGEEVAEVSNVHDFKALRAHPTWGEFFWNEDDFAGFLVGEKFAEGAQAELHHAMVVWKNLEANEFVRRNGVEYVVKVFKKGTFLRDLQLQVPHGYLQFRADYRDMIEGKSNVVLLPRFQSGVECGVLLKNGQFAFLMLKEHFDLRHLIERNMKSRSCQCEGPFSKEEGEIIMYGVALGMDWLHGHSIIHRDLKASNVLVKECKSGFPKHFCYVADFECSVGVVGTGFFRAPEILQACKDQSLSLRPEVFSKAVDVYGFGMVCYEVLTGKLPFEDHPQSDYDLVLTGRRPTLPEYVEDWMCNLLNSCWQSNPIKRPSFEEILDIFVIYSTVARRREEQLKIDYGNNFRNWQLF
ncbi:hypothetical protein KC19_11G050700 [Ceratodon purpureus]|uniref:Protein kinase domain-containing protein n=1 Tax=Ceratodon purpureus TaxID=3225 RepID=A0A8T0GAM4_CERPU|nr:hypothetical protein KC19_11G050700 [Ceratodon purpureus]